MPPRYAYWTILIGDEPTAFRSGSQEDLMPTFKRLKEKQPSAKMMWFQNGKLWESRIDAQEAMRARGEIGRRSDPRQEERGKRPFKPAGERYSDRAPRASERRAERAPSGKLDWKPKSDVRSYEGEARGARRSAQREGGPKAAWKPRTDWKPKGRPEERSRSEKLDWKPKGSTSGSRIPDPGSREKRKWVPKEEYKRSQAPSPKSQAPRDKNWRPGGEHKDPRQKYKDAKKAKWTRFKKNIRARSEGKPRKNDE